MRILFFSDMHFPYSGLLDDELLYARNLLFIPFLNEIFSLKSDIVISLGDLVLDGLKEEMDEVYAHVKGNFYHILGNHDRIKFSLNELIDNKFRHGDTFLMYNQCDIILLETARDKNSQNWGGTLSDLQILWLKKCVEKNPEKPLLIFAHHPIFNTVRKSNYDMYSIDKNCEILPILKSRKGLCFYISGHTHTDDILRDGNIIFISASSVIDARIIRTLDISKKEIYYKSVDFNTKNTILEAKKLEKNLAEFNMSKFSVGSVLETNARFKI